MRYFLDAISNRFDVTEIAVFGAKNARCYAGGRATVFQSRDPQLKTLCTAYDEHAKMYSTEYDCQVCIILSSAAVSNDIAIEALSRTA
jgi:hypothetical protein